MHLLFQNKTPVVAGCPVLVGRIGRGINLETKERDVLANRAREHRQLHRAIRTVAIRVLEQGVFPGRLLPGIHGGVRVAAQQLAAYQQGHAVRVTTDRIEASAQGLNPPLVHGLHVVKRNQVVKRGWANLRAPPKALERGATKVGRKPAPQQFPVHLAIRTGHEAVDEMLVHAHKHHQVLRNAVDAGHEGVFVPFGKAPVKRLRQFRPVHDPVEQFGNHEAVTGQRVGAGQMRRHKSAVSAQGQAGY